MLSGEFLSRRFLAADTQRVHAVVSFAEHTLEAQGSNSAPNPVPTPDGEPTDGHFYVLCLQSYSLHVQSVGEPLSLDRAKCRGRTYHTCPKANGVTACPQRGQAYISVDFCKARAR
jgi:hypothetical protein